MITTSFVQGSAIGRTRPLALVAALAVLVASLAGARPVGAQTKVEATTPAGGWYQPGTITPVVVTIEAGGATSGLISIQFEGMTVASQVFDIPGGSTKRIVVSTPTPPWGGNGSVVVDTGDDTITARLGLTTAGESELVGVFSALADRGLDAIADLTVDLGQARLFAIDPALLDTSGETLRVFTHVVAMPDELNGLGDRLRDLEDWIIAGGQLIVDGPPEAAVPLELGAPIGDTSGQATYRFGQGTVMFTNGDISARGFDGIISPTPSATNQNMPFGGFGTMPATPFLAADAGFRVPEILSLVVFLLLYIALAGPVAYTIIRRSNREPALWLIIPALAILATGGVWIFGRQLRENVNTAHATLVADLPSGQTIASQTLVASPGGGDVGVVLPDTWRPASRSFDDMMMGMEFGQVTTGAPFERDGELLVDLAPGGIAVVQAETRRPVTAERSWEASLEVIDDVLVGTVTNLTQYELTDVTVSSGIAIDRIRTVGPGETVEVSMGKPGRVVTGEDPTTSRMWQVDMNDSEEAINPSIWSGWVVANPHLVSPENILILGWTRDAPGPLSTSNGQPVTNGRTGFLTVEPLVARDGLIGPATNRVRILRGWESTRVNDASRAQFDEFGVAIRITPTSDPTGQELVLKVPLFVAALDLWDGTDWIPAGMADHLGTTTFAVPDGSFADGSLYLRFRLGDEWWGQAEVFPTVRSRVPDDEVFELAGADDV